MPSRSQIRGRETTMLPPGGLRSRSHKRRTVEAPICPERRAYARTEHKMIWDERRVGGRAHLSQRGQWRHYKIYPLPPQCGGGSRASSTPRAQCALLNRQDRVPVIKMIHQWARPSALPIRGPTQVQVPISRSPWIFERPQIHSGLCSPLPHSRLQSSVQQMSSL